MTEVKNSKLDNLINDLYKNSNNKRNEKNALKGKETLRQKLTKPTTLITFGLYGRLTREQRDAVQQNDEKCEPVRLGILKMIYNYIIEMEADRDVPIYINYNKQGLDILRDYVTGEKHGTKSVSKAKKKLNLRSIITNQERQKLDG